MFLRIILLIGLVFFSSPVFASKIFIYEDQETGEKYYSNLPLNENFKIYMKLPLKRGKRDTLALTSLKRGFNEGAFSSKFDEIFNEVAKQFNLDPQLLKAMAKVESNFNPQAVSPKGAMGVMQLIPSTARLVGVNNPFDPVENIYGGARYLKMLLDEFGDLKLSLAAYNAGPEAVKSYRGIPPYSETVNYVRDVLYYYERFRKNSL